MDKPWTWPWLILDRFWSSLKLWEACAAETWPNFHDLQALSVVHIWDADIYYLLDVLPSPFSNLVVRNFFQPCELCSLFHLRLVWPIVPTDDLHHLLSGLPSNTQHLGLWHYTTYHAPTLAVLFQPHDLGAAPPTTFFLTIPPIVYNAYSYT